jgi:hypothetical protein
MPRNMQLLKQRLETDAGAPSGNVNEADSEEEG